MAIFFWEVAKGIICRENVQHMNELRDTILRAAESVTNEILSSTWRETECRLDVCLATNGGHIEICGAYDKLREAQCLKMYRFLKYTLWLKMLEGVSKSFRTGRLELELQMVQLSATRCSCIAILRVSLVSFAAKTLCVALQRVFIVVAIVYFGIDSVRKLLDTPSYTVLFHCHLRLDTLDYCF
jgi:hypothetical protein